MIDQASGKFVLVADELTINLNFVQGGRARCPFQHTRETPFKFALFPALVSFGRCLVVALQTLFASFGGVEFAKFSQDLN